MQTYDLIAKSDRKSVQLRLFLLENAISWSRERETNKKGRWTVAYFPDASSYSAKWRRNFRFAAGTRTTHMDWKRETPDIEFGTFPTFRLALWQPTLLREFCFISFSLLHVKCIILCDPDESKFNIQFKSRVIHLKCKRK